MFFKQAFKGTFYNPVIEIQLLKEAVAKKFHPIM